MGLAGVILAAGESTRMGRDKALLPWPSGSPHASNPPKGGAAVVTTLLSAAIGALEKFCDLVIVVAGNNEPALRPVVYACGAFLVRNLAPERGQFSSLQTGMHEVLSRGHDNGMVTLVDRPPLESGTLAFLVGSFTSRGHNCWAVIPEYQGKHGHPILVGREMIERFLKAPVTATAREIEHADPERISYVSVDDPLVTTNINTPEDYALLQSQKP